MPGVLRIEDDSCSFTALEWEVGGPCLSDDGHGICWDVHFPIQFTPVMSIGNVVHFASEYREYANTGLS